MNVQVGAETRASHRHLPGVTVELVDYRWAANSRIVSSEPDITVRWRLWPNRVTMTAAMMAQPQANIGRLMIHQPNVPWFSVAKHASGMATLVQCRFSKSWLLSQLGEHFPALSDYLASSLDVRNDNIDYLMRRIAQELTHPDSNSVEMIDSAVTMLGVELVRHARAIRQEHDGTESYGDRVSEIRAMVRTSDEVLTISELDRKSTRLNSSHIQKSRMPSSA